MSDEPALRVDPRNDQGKYEVLSKVTDLIVQHGTLPELIHQIARSLEQVAAFQYLCVSLYDATKNCLRLHLWEGEGVPPVPLEVSLENTPSGLVWVSQEPLLLRDLVEDQRFPVLNGMRARIPHLRTGAANQRSKADWRNGDGLAHARCLYTE
jgi:hypothetical protein